MIPVTELPVKDGQARVEDFPPEQRFSFANNGTTYPQYCLGGQEHEWQRIRTPFGPPYQSGLHEDKCVLCGWQHSVDSGD